MFKKLLIFLSLIILLLAFALVIFFQFNSSGNKNQTEINNIQITPTPTIELVLWQDPAQFSVQYPKDINIDNHQEDNINYAHLEFKKEDKKGYLTIWVKDTIQNTTAGYVKENKLTDYIETTLGGYEAVKLLKTSESGIRTIIVYCIKDGYLYEINVGLEDYDYWSGVFNLVFDTFKFTADIEESPKSNNQDQTVGQNEIIEEEEFIE
jgi:hypothetical protein